MKREIITIGENGKIHIQTITVWMSACEIASLFGVFSGKVNSHIKSIFKEGLLREDEVMQTLLFRDGSVDLYNLEMITMLAFRFASPEAKSFRKWIIGRLTKKKRTSPPLLVCYGKGGWYN
ncbi:hypothetical protein [Porphyromonas gingivalis]|uniref:hypothetical protein n=1 Tax=Porphyromonas gingivalis TaxID=837 RepID=UPI000C1772C2|nr:hypothetical protein [Porphyromonas gingivalis]ATR92844.1 hypothetical protein CS545_07070 [Porphyromonas gingivalis]ATS05297.1 hypothetical protein CS374_10190 [Porphyromonas gingivalis]